MPAVPERKVLLSVLESEVLPTALVSGMLPTVLGGEVLFSALESEALFSVLESKTLPAALENIVFPAGIRHGYPSDPSAKRKRTTTVMPYKSSKKATMLISTAEKPRNGTRIRSFNSSLSMGVILVHSCFMTT